MSSPQHEPTMEEILASIRKIISEDSPADAPAAGAVEVQQVAAAPVYAEPVHNQPDVLELTQEVIETPAPQPMPMAADDIIFETDTPAQPAPSNDIFSDHTRKALDNAFASIPEEEPAPAPSRPAPAALAPLDGNSVETVFERAVRESFEPVLQKYISDNSVAVIDRMKPLIREWMDEHFPALLEGAVRAEVERVVKSRGKR
jgi:cell pole-organizing protein PopZ